ncbi:MAG: hypothetical protein EOP84_36120 [Verrucomicrobiaceae bacterium]|nr:MAG: hypothetical protein EOP84_36120 [Verrucomicrobiaceae bacterium]
MPRILQVYWGSRLAGHLQQDDSGALSFSYEPEWQESGYPLSASLPLSTGSFVARECRPFFAGLLPEQESRKLVAQSFGVSERNDFALLEKIGAECAGAVSLIPAGMAPPTGCGNISRSRWISWRIGLCYSPVAPFWQARTGSGFRWPAPRGNWQWPSTETS